MSPQALEELSKLQKLPMGVNPASNVFKSEAILLHSDKYIWSDENSYIICIFFNLLIGQPVRQM